MKTYLDDDLRYRSLNPKESFIVQAPAGSGKTELLTNRILSLLTVVRRPEEILAITFTKKAVLEMRDRVLEKLKLGLSEMPSDSDEIISWKLSKQILERDSFFSWCLLKYPDRINIKTFDSLCFDLVSSFPDLSNISSLPSITEDAKKHYKEAAFSTINLAENYPCVRSLISHLDIDIKSVVDYISNMLSIRDQWLPILPSRFSKDFLQKELNVSIERNIEKLLSLMPNNWMKDLKYPIMMASKIVCEDNDSSILIDLLDWNCHLDPNISSLKKIKALASIFLTSQNKLRNPKGLNRKNGFPAGTSHRKIFSEWLTTVKDNDFWIIYLVMLRHIPCLITEKYWISLSDQLKVLLLSVDNLLLHFNQKEELDFIEISQRSVDILLKKDIQSDSILKTSHILIDEFQDTNQIHFKLLENIISGWQQNCGKSIFIVGDPMQSIYRFRGSEVGLFLNIVEHGIGQIKPIFLKLFSNFRSQANLVNWANSVFGSLFPPDNDKNIGAISYNPSVPANQKLDGDAVYFHPLFTNNIIDNELEEFSLKIISKILEDSKSNNQESTAILVHSRSSLGNIINILSKNKISFRATEMTSLSEKPMVSDLIQLIRAISHPGDRLAWFSLLRSPFCGLKLDTLHKIFGSDHKTPIPVILRKILDNHDSIVNDSDGYIMFFLNEETNEKKLLPLSEYNRLLRIAFILLHKEYSGLFSFSAWIRYLWDLLEGPSVYDDPENETYIENIFCLIDKISNNGIIDADILEEEISKLLITLDQVKAGEPFIEIMTIHKSKGLQFDNVILYGMHNSFNKNRASVMKFENALFSTIKSRVNDDHDPIAQYLLYKEKLKDNYELDRLLYVAITRAKKRLHIISPISLKEDKVVAPSSDSLLIRLWNHLDYKTPIITDIKDNSIYENTYFNNSLISRIICNDITHIENLIFNYRNKSYFNYFWNLDFDYKSIIDKLIIDWLYQIGSSGINNYSKGFREYLPTIKKQLIRKNFFCNSIEETAIFIVDVIENFLKDNVGMWILSFKKSYRNVSFIDQDGSFLKPDVILDLGSRWLLLEYNLSMIGKNESIEHFVNRIRNNSYKLSNFCNKSTLIEGKPLNAAICFPIYKMLVDV